MDKERFSQFTGWELQALARGVSLAPAHRAEQAEAAIVLLEEINNEFDTRERLKFADPTKTRT